VTGCGTPDPVDLPGPAPAVPGGPSGAEDAAPFQGEEAVGRRPDMHVFPVFPVAIGRHQPPSADGGPSAARAAAPRPHGRGARTPGGIWREGPSGVPGHPGR
jgi:hypothetical protein